MSAVEKEPDVEGGLENFDARNGRGSRDEDDARDPDSDVARTVQASDGETWDWKSDPDNPHNWGGRRKWAQIAMMAPVALVS